MERRHAKIRSIFAVDATAISLRRSSLFLRRHQVINVDLYAKPEWFLSRNPLGNIPVLERDGEVIYESLICNDWLEKNYPDKPLDPPDSYTKYQWRMLLTLFDVEVSSRVLGSQPGEPGFESRLCDVLAFTLAENTKKPHYEAEH